MHSDKCFAQKNNEMYAGAISGQAAQQTNLIRLFSTVKTFLTTDRTLALVNQFVILQSICNTARQALKLVKHANVSNQFLKTMQKHEDSAYTVVHDFIQTLKTNMFKATCWLRTDRNANFN